MPPANRRPSGSRPPVRDRGVASGRAWTRRRWAALRQASEQKRRGRPYGARSKARRQLAHWLARATSVAGPDMAVDDTTLSSRATGSVCAHFSVGEGVGITLRCAAPYFPLWLTFATSSTLMRSAY